MMETRTINLRDLPEKLVRRAKAHAALSGITLKEFVATAIEKSLEREISHSKFQPKTLRRTRTKGAASSKVKPKKER